MPSRPPRPDADRASEGAVGVSVVIPCHNEAASIGAVVRGVIEALGDQLHEVLIVDDGSTDGTSERAEQAGAAVLRLEPNRGKGVALLAGARAASHPVLACLDGDGQDDPSELPRLLDALVPGVEMVIGSRFQGTFHQGAIHPLNRVATTAFNRLISVLFGTRITDSQAGFRAFDRGALLALDLSAREYDIETETLVKGLAAGWRVVEVPVGRYARTGSETDFRRVRHGLLILRTILRVRLAR